MSDLNVDSIFVLSALDKLMSEHKATPAIFCKLFEKKKLIINLLQQRKIDGKKYKMIVGKAIKDENPLVKACASNDALKLKDAKDEDMINLWFKEMIDATGVSYENQEKLYQKYQSPVQPQQQQKPQPPPQPKAEPQPQPKQEFKQVDATKTQQIKVQPKKIEPEPSNVSSSIVGGINLEEIVSFKVVDNLLEKYEEKKEFYQRFLQRKRRLLELVNTKALTAEKYKSTIVALQSRIKNEDIVSDMKFELEGIEDFHDGNVESWFKDVVKQSKDNLKEQEQHLNDLNKGKSIKKESKQISLQIQAEKSKIKDNSPIDLKEVVTFKVIEEQLENNEENKVNYKILLDKKKNLLQLYKKGALTADKYKALISKSIQQIKNSEIKESMAMEISQIDDLHDGNIQDWFKDIISNAELFYEDQNKKLTELQKGIISQKSKKDDIKFSDEELNISDDDDETEKNKKPSPAPVQPAQNVEKNPAPKGGKVLLDFKQLYSLKAIDEYLEQYGKNPEIFCLCFERKLQIFEMMKNGEITPQKYKELQVKTLKTTQNQKLRDLVEMDLVDLKDICDNNVNEWFESLVNDAGFNYEDQEALYNKYSKKSPNKFQDNQPSSISENPQSSSAKITQKPVINDVICFTAIFKLFKYAVERVDIMYYKELQIKREKLIDLISQKKLIPSKYRDINKTSSSKTNNDFLKKTIAEEQARLKAQFKGDEQSWFESLVTILKSTPPELVLPQNKEMKRVNSGSTPKKVQYFLRNMATYECLYYFFKKNKIPIETNKYLEEYEKKKRKEVIHCLEMIQKDQNLDVYNLSLQMFPEINNDIFYGDNLPGLKNKIQQYIPLIAKEIAALKDYTSKIKKSTNTENIDKAKKQIAKCEETIAFLKSWPQGAMVPFPTITEQKIEKYNLDVNSKLDKNEIQVIITNVSGLSGELIMNIYLVDHTKQRYSAKVNNGPVNARFVAKLNEKEMFQICKGDKKHLLVRFFKRGFFGGLSQVCQGTIETIFVRNNIIEEKTMIGQFEVNYVLKVHKPTKPLVTQIMHYEVTQFPKYKHDKFVEEELIKKYIMYSSPTPSEIISVDP